MEELEFKKTLAQALLSALSKGTICLENSTTNFVKLIFPCIKTVSHQTLERGDVTVTLLPIKQSQALPRDLQEAVSTLIQQEHLPVSNEILTDLQNTLNSSKYPVLRINVSRSLLTLWLQHSSVTQWVLLKALGNRVNWTQKKQPSLNKCKISSPQQEQCLSTVSCSQSSTNSDAISPAAGTLYGSNNELKNVMVHLQIGARIQCLCRCYTCLPSDLTVYRTHVVAQHAATLVRLAGGRVLCCCCIDADQGPAIVAEGDDSELTGQKVLNLLYQDENFKNICVINCSDFQEKIAVKNATVTHLNTEFKEYLPSKTLLSNTAELPILPEFLSISAHEASVPDVCATINASSTPLPVAANTVMRPCLRQLTVSCRSVGKVPGMMEVGPVLADHNRKKVKDLDVTQCWRLILSELRRACAHKRTDVNSSWCAELPGLACSCLRLLMLTPAAETPLLLHTQGEDNVRDAAFLLYNYARVCALLRSFDRLQQLGSIPPLPPPQQVHYQTLREPEEWELVWVYIYKFPGLVAGLADEIVRITAECCADGSGHICSDKLRESKPSLSARPFNSHAVCRFLHGLCHCFSVYYNRVHVLPAVRNNISALNEQLLQTLFARIYLLTAVKNTMYAAFFVLGVLPPTQM